MHGRNNARCNKKTPDQPRTTTRRLRRQHHPSSRTHTRRAPNVLDILLLLPCSTLHRTCHSPNPSTGAPHCRYTTASCTPLQRRNRVRHLPRRQRRPSRTNNTAAPRRGIIHRVRPLRSRCRSPTRHARNGRPRSSSNHTARRRTHCAFRARSSRRGCGCGSVRSRAPRQGRSRRRSGN